jgi:glycosyltransferase involved in cell wall biosynthesis
MRVSYVTPFYNGACDGRFGRFHDWVHTLRDTDERPYEFDVHAATASNPDETLASRPSNYLGEASELWATKRNNVEILLNLTRIHRDLRRTDPDIVHLVAFDSLLLPPVLSASRGTPMVVGPNIGGWYPPRAEEFWLAGPIQELKMKGKFLRRKLLMNRLEYSHVVAFSSYHRRMLRLLGVNDRDMTTLRPGVDRVFSPRAEVPPSKSAPELLYVGDFSEHKGYSMFLRAVSRLDRDVSVRVIGSGDPDERSLRSLDIEDQVTVEGFVDRPRLPEYYRSADLFVLPSIDETGPNTKFEALACGTPVVVTDAPGLIDFTPSDAAVCFSPRAPEGLARAIETALEDITSLTRAARRRASEFHASTTVAHLDSLYRSMV